jgi:hypothetical protein
MLLAVVCGVLMALGLGLGVTLLALAVRDRLVVQRSLVISRKREDQSAEDGWGTSLLFAASDAADVERKTIEGDDLWDALGGNHVEPVPIRRPPTN